MELGNKILKLRKQKGLSQEQLGEKVNVTRQTISNWELGETLPNPEQLKLLSKELHISIDELLDNTEGKIINRDNNSGFKKVIKYVSLFLADIFASAGFILLYSWLLVMILFSISSLVIALSLIIQFNIRNLIPYIPYWCGFIIAISLIILSILFILCGIIYGAFITKLLHSYKRIHHYVLSNEISNMEKTKEINILNNTKLITAIKILLISFILIFMISFIVCVLHAGNLAFWHTWCWWG